MLGRSRRESLGSPEPGHVGSPTSLCRPHLCPVSSWVPSQGGSKPGSGGVPALAAIAFRLSSIKEHIWKVCEIKKSPCKASWRMNRVLMCRSLEREIIVQVGMKFS